MITSFCFPARQGRQAVFVVFVVSRKIAIPEANPDARSLTACSFKWPNRRYHTSSGGAVPDGVAFEIACRVAPWVAFEVAAEVASEVAAKVASEVALRAKVLLSTTRHCSLYIPLILLHEATEIPDLSIK